MTSPDPVVVAPFGAHVAGVLALVPEARVPKAAEVPAGRHAVTEEQVLEWLVGLSARLAVRLDGWERLKVEPEEPETLSDRDTFVAHAADLVHNGAASYLEAARYPERAGKSTTSYDAVLWQRFVDGLDDLAAWLERRLAAGDATTPGGADTPVPAHSFPPASFTPARLVF